MSKGRLVAYVSLLYFGSMLIVASMASFLLQPRFYPDQSFGLADVFLSLSWPMMIVAIFLFNLVLASFLFVTLPGFVFFPLSLAALFIRAFLWGLLVFPLSASAFLAILPTLVLEGEAYVLACVAGITVGYAWFAPARTYHMENVSRGGAFRRSLRACLGIYLFVSIILLVAAVVETTTILILKG